MKNLRGFEESLIPTIKIKECSLDNNEFPGWHGMNCRCKEERQSCHCGGWSSQPWTNRYQRVGAKVRKLSQAVMTSLRVLQVPLRMPSHFERLEAKLEASPGQLARASVELAKDWRTDKYLKSLRRC